MFRRLRSPLAAVVLVLAFVLPSASVGAEETGSTFTLRSGVCSWMEPGYPQVVFEPALGSDDSAYDCEAGIWPAENFGFVLDGVSPDSTDGATWTWTNIPDGPHSLDSSPYAPVRLHEDVTIDGDTERWATLYFPNTGDRPAMAPTPEAGSTLTLGVWTCNMTGGLPGLVVAEHANESGVGRNCVEGAVGSSSITVDGVVGTVTGNQVVWTGLSGDVVISAPVAAVDGGSQTIASDTTLFATFYVSDLTPEAAIPAGSGSVRIFVAECAIAPVGESWIGGERQGPRDWTDCHSQNIDAKEWGLRVDGRRPDTFVDDWASWTLANGTHVATTESGARYEFTVQDDQVTLAAWFGPDGMANGGASATTQTPVGGAAVTALPKTGTGTDSHDLPVAMALIGASLMMTVIAGAFALRTQRIRRS